MHHSWSTQVWITQLLLCKHTIPAFYLVNIHQTAPPWLVVATICSIQQSVYMDKAKQVAKCKVQTAYRTKFRRPMLFLYAAWRHFACLEMFNNPPHYQQKHWAECAHYYESAPAPMCNRQQCRCQCQQAFVMRPLQVDRWRITIRNDNMLSVAVDTVK